MNRDLGRGRRREDKKLTRQRRKNGGKSAGARSWDKEEGGIVPSQTSIVIYRTQSPRERTGERSGLELRFQFIPELKPDSCCYILSSSGLWQISSDATASQFWKSSWLVSVYVPDRMCNVKTKCFPTFVWFVSLKDLCFYRLTHIRLVTNFNEDNNTKKWEENCVENPTNCTLLLTFFCYFDITNTTMLANQSPRFLRLRWKASENHCSLLLFEGVPPAVDYILLLTLGLYEAFV